MNIAQKVPRSLWWRAAPAKVSISSGALRAAGAARFNSHSATVAKSVTWMTTSCAATVVGSSVVTGIVNWWFSFDPVNERDWLLSA
eukprot:m.306994 g.306994  ORF g.306994 m.306994 type:complete len:86 (+) comp41800_c0_seq1:140-397(+)